jgi:hypothetical protein
VVRLRDARGAVPVVTMGSALLAVRVMVVAIMALLFVVALLVFALLGVVALVLGVRLAVGLNAGLRDARRAVPVVGVRLTGGSGSRSVLLVLFTTLVLGVRLAIRLEARLRNTRRTVPVVSVRLACCRGGGSGRRLLRSGGGESNEDVRDPSLGLHVCGCVCVGSGKLLQKRFVQRMNQHRPSITGAGVYIGWVLLGQRFRNFS